jgi:integral membrane sensor domain MASE1
MLTVLTVLIGCFALGGNLGCLAARIITHSGSPISGMFGLFVGGALGVLFLGKYAVNLTLRFLQKPRLFRIKVFTLGLTVLFLLLCAALNLKSIEPQSVPQEVLSR